MGVYPNVGAQFMLGWDECRSLNSRFSNPGMEDRYWDE